MLRLELPRRHVDLLDQLLDHVAEVRAAEDHHLPRLLQGLHQHARLQLRARHLLQGLVDPRGHLLHVGVGDRDRLVFPLFRLAFIELGDPFA